MSLVTSDQEGGGVRPSSVPSKWCSWGPHSECAILNLCRLIQPGGRMHRLGAHAAAMQPCVACQQELLEGLDLRTRRDLPLESGTLAPGVIWQSSRRPASKWHREPGAEEPGSAPREVL